MMIWSINSSPVKYIQIHCGMERGKWRKMLASGFDNRVGMPMNSASTRILTDWNIAAQLNFVKRVSSIKKPLEAGRLERRHINLPYGIWKMLALNNSAER